MHKTSFSNWIAIIRRVFKKQSVTPVGVVDIYMPTWILVLEPGGKPINRILARVLTAVLGPEMRQYLTPPDSPLSADKICRLDVDLLSESPETVERVRSYARGKLDNLLRAGLEPSENWRRWTSFCEGRSPNERILWVHVQTDNAGYEVYLDSSFSVRCAEVTPPLHTPLPRNQRWWIRFNLLERVLTLFKARS